MLPSTSEALRGGARAAVKSAWLVAPALVVAGLRAALVWPAIAFAVATARAGALGALAAGRAPSWADAALEALLAPRALAIGAGLAVAGWLAGAALRVAFLAGALPVLGGALAGAPRGSAAFVEGLARGFARLLGTALLALALDLLANLFAAVVLGSALLLAANPPGGVPGVTAAALGAVLLCAALAGLPLASLAGDAALARAALADDTPALALAVGGERVLRRPAVFLLAAAAIGLLGFAVVGSAGALETSTLALASGAPAPVVLGPRLMLGALAAALSALFELWRLATVAALACASPRVSDRAAA